MSPEKMVHMANQIATFFKTQQGDATEKVAAHISDFWEPRMREQLRDYVDHQGGVGLDHVVVDATALLH